MIAFMGFALHAQQSTATVTGIITDPSGAQSLDASLAKNVQITERLKMQLRADTFNTLNHTNLFGMVTTITSATFGRLTQATARTMQVGARLTF